MHRQQTPISFAPDPVEARSASALAVLDATVK
jgi:hypothetical protein